MNAALNLPPTFHARTPEQARLLLDEACQEVLACVMAQECSASEVARSTGQPLKQAHHRLTRLLTASLVEVVGARRRGGRPMKVYRAVGRVYHVPFALTEAATVEEFIQRLTGPFLREVAGQLVQLFMREDEHELTLGLSGHGRPMLNFNPRAFRESRQDSYGALASINRPRLTPAGQWELERRLRDLSAWVTAQEQAQRDDPDASPCLLGVFFTPVRPGS